MEKNKFKSGCVKRAAARRFFLLLSSGKYVFSISDLMITVPAYKQMNFCLRNCKLTNKYPPAKPGVFHMRAKPSDPRGHVKRVIRSASRAGTVTCYP